MDLGLPMRRTLRFVPIEIIAEIKTEKGAIRMCLDEYNKSRSTEDQVLDWQWAALCGIKKGLFSEYMSEKNKKHPPEPFRDKIEQLTGYALITQYHAFKRGLKLVPIEENEQLRLKERENEKLKNELAELKQQQAT